MSKSDLTPSSLGDRAMVAPKCDHYWIYKSPAGTREGVEICQYCHQPNPADLDRLAMIGAPDVLHQRIGQLQKSVSNLEGFRRLVSDLSRCKHGRLQGDNCAGWTGPGLQDGGCQGGISMGNLGLQPGDRIGWAIDGKPITVPSHEERHKSAAWYAS